MQHSPRPHHEHLALGESQKQVLQLFGATRLFCGGGPSQPIQMFLGFSLAVISTNHDPLKNEEREFVSALQGKGARAKTHFRSKV
jgi:hypothetical protein